VLSSKREHTIKSVRKSRQYATEEASESSSAISEVPLTIQSNRPITLLPSKNGYGKKDAAIIADEPFFGRVLITVLHAKEMSSPYDVQ
jgi:hypothetical protein